jgi:hypothetical protein
MDTSFLQLSDESYAASLLDKAGEGLASDSHQHNNRRNSKQLE